MRAHSNNSTNIANFCDGNDRRWVGGWGGERTEYFAQAQSVSLSSSSNACAQKEDAKIHLFKLVYKKMVKDLMAQWKRKWQIPHYGDNSRNAVIVVKLPNVYLFFYKSLPDTNLFYIRFLFDGIHCKIDFRRKMNYDIYIIYSIVFFVMFFAPLDLYLIKSIKTSITSLQNEHLYIIHKCQISFTL